MKNGLVCYGFRITQEDRGTLYKLEDVSTGTSVLVGSQLNVIDLELVRAVVGRRLYDGFSLLVVYCRTILVARSGILCNGVCHSLSLR